MIAVFKVSLEPVGTALMTPVLNRVAMAFLAVGLVVAGPVHAQQSGTGPLYNKPVFNPATNSYFELVRVRSDQSVHSARKQREVRWAIAQRFATERGYKGVQGRLAIVDNIETHNFLKRTFRPDHITWFGLRYWCAYRKMQWSDGDVHPFTAFAAWDPDWDRSVGGSCSGTPYLAIAYSPYRAGFRWIAYAHGKEFDAYFVEYPVKGSAAPTD